MTPEAALQQLREQNVVMSGGTPVLGSAAFTVETSGELHTPDDLRRFLLSVPGRSRATEVPLGSLADVRAMPPDPPESAAIYQGQSGRGGGSLDGKRPEHH